MDAKAGLRERKREETRQRLTGAALALFVKHGFDGTTVDDIADAANVSRRTFFHYFASKEDVAFAWQDSFGEGLVEAVAAQPAAPDPLTLAERALLFQLEAFSVEQASALSRLVEETPALRARDQVKYEGMERAFAEALRKRFPKKSDELTVRLAAMIVVGAMRVSSTYYRSKNIRQRPAEHAREVIALLRKQLQS
jgi:AcrR family transcriptional regulator